MMEILHLLADKRIHCLVRIFVLFLLSEKFLIFLSAPNADIKSLAQFTQCLIDDLYECHY